MGNERPPTPDGTAKTIARFACLFLGCTLVFHLIFDYNQGLVGLIYVIPIYRVAEFILRAIGIHAEVMRDLELGICTLLLDPISYRITQGCTGIFTSSLYVSGVVSYPVGVSKKLVGLLIGVPAFFVFGALRIVIMGVVATVQPARVEIFHIYIMAMANLGFAMFVWVYWYHKVIEREKRGSVPG
jgi:exosortase/archaeosortase family protein